ANQHGFGIQRIASTHKFLGSNGGWLVHHFETRRYNSSSNNACYRICSLFNSIKASQNTLRKTRGRRELERDLGYNSQHALGTNQKGHHVISRSIERVTAYLENFTINGNTTNTQDIVHCEAVFQAMHTARIFSDVTPNCASNLRRRIGGVVQPIRLSCLRNLNIAHPWLHSGCTRIQIG